MIALDTNVLARAILEDDKKQTLLAQSFLEKHTQRGYLYLSPFMILELVWVLKSKGILREEIIPIIDKLINADGVTVGQKNVIVAALDLFSKKNISFADCIITCDAHLNASAKTVTFDRALIKADDRCQLLR